MKSNLIALFLVLIFAAAPSPAVHLVDGDQPAVVMLPAGLLHLGSDGSYALVVNKADSRIDVYQQNGDGNIAKVRSYRTSTGRAEGDKMVEGDLKTPEGVYYLVRIREDKELLSKYGIRAFDLNYPNQLDRIADKTGYGIWLHGTDEPERLSIPRTSEGCVVVSNEDLKQISDYITLYRTPVIIGEELPLAPSTELVEARQRVSNFVLRWLDAWANQDIQRYGQCYGSTFRGSPGRRAAWLQRKKRVFKATQWANIDISDLKMLRHGDNIVVSFYQRYRSNLMDDTGIKWVYLRENGDSLSIVSEEWHPVRKVVSGKAWNNENKENAEVLGHVVRSSDGTFAIADPFASLPLNAGLADAEPLVEEAVAEIRTTDADNEESESASADTRAAERSTDATQPEITREEPPVNKPVYDRVGGTPSVLVEKFAITAMSGSRMNVSFELVNQNQTGERRRGWIYLVAEWNDGRQYSAFPSGNLKVGMPTDPARGDSYGIRWFKIVETSLQRPTPDAELTSLVCYVFDRQERLINDQLVFGSSREE